NAVSTGTTVIPIDDTPPQVTEGVAVLSLSHTPKASNYVLHIQGVVYISTSIANNNLIAALFTGASSDAIGVMTTRSAATADTDHTIAVEAFYVATGTSPLTISLRAGGNGASTVTINGASATRRFGTVPKSTLTVTEYKA